MSKPVIRVLHVCEIVRGGVATHLRISVPAQRQTWGEEAVVGIYPSRYQADLESVFAVSVLVPWNGRGPWSLFAYGAATARAIYRLKPDLVHAHSSLGGLIARFAILLMLGQRRPKLMYCPHGWAFLMEGSRLRNWIYAIVERLLARATDALVHISEHEATEAALRNIHAPIEVVIPHGLPRPNIRPNVHDVAGKTLTVLFAGRLVRQKGFDILMAALRHLQRRDVTVHVAGETVGASQPLADDDRLVMHGWLSPAELDELYCQTDVVVMPSRWEGFGYVAVEAMRAGRPIFAAARGALPALVIDGENGRLFDPDLPASLAALLENADVHDLREMGQRGYKRFLDYHTADRSNAALIALQHTLLTQCSRARSGKITRVNPVSR